MDDYLEFIPQSSIELIEILDRVTPELCYDITRTKEDNIFYAGQRSIINGLLLILENQKEEG